MKNRFDIEVRKGYAVTYHLPRGGKETGTVARVAREGGAYRVTLTSGASCALDDIASAETVLASTKALELMYISLNAVDAIERAEGAHAAVTQDWDHEATLFTFADGSVLVVCDPQVNAYADMASASDALNA